MAGKKIISLKKTDTKALHKEIKSKLAVTLARYKSQLGAKKFENKIKKASNLFTEALAKAAKKNKKKVVLKKKVALKKKPLQKKVLSNRQPI